MNIEFGLKGCQFISQLTESSCVTDVLTGSGRNFGPCGTGHLDHSKISYLFHSEPLYLHTVAQALNLNVNSDCFPSTHHL